MTVPAYGSVGELLGFLATALAAGVLTVVGALAESAGLDAVLTGQAILGAWELGMGALALYAGVYMLGYQRVWRPLTASN